MAKLAPGAARSFANVLAQMGGVVPLGRNATMPDERVAACLARACIR